MLVSGELGSGQDDVRARRLPRARRRRAGDEPDVHDRSGLRGPASRSPTSTSTGSHSLAGEDPALLDDYLTPERIGFVEWPDLAEPRLARVAARVRLEHAGGDRRTIEIE